MYTRQNLIDVTAEIMLKLQRLEAENIELRKRLADQVPDGAQRINRRFVPIFEIVDELSAYAPTLS